MKPLYHIRGHIRGYDWGGSRFISELLGVDNTAGSPQAEYWLGAHVSAPSVLSEEGSSVEDLLKLIEKDPKRVLGEAVAQRFGGLPYLFKVLDVKDMLSIQVHPTKEAAEKGFAEEERKGVPLSSPQRNYKDRNHKPELMLALSEFWLLHGFRSEEAVRSSLAARDCYAPMIDVLDESGMKGLFLWCLDAESCEVDAVARTLLAELEAEELEDKSSHEYWIKKWASDPKRSRVGLLVILLLNVVKANAGETVFQGAGVIHAYLEGRNIELMANSDNVLRGGLTSKHVDVEELALHTKFETIDPLGSFISPSDGSDHEKRYEAPVEDFLLSELSLRMGEASALDSVGLEILFVAEGSGGIHLSAASGDFQYKLSQGDAFAVVDGCAYEVSSDSDRLRVFRAQVNL